LKLDFVKERDTKPKYWLIGFVSFSLAATTLFKSLNTAIAKQHISLICKMCGIKFKYKEIINTLVLSVLLEVKEYASKRKVNNIFARITRPKQLAATHNCKVCTLCYSVIVQEKRLIEVEKKMSLVQLIPILNIYAII
jgi:hypothetical protein